MMHVVAHSTVGYVITFVASRRLHIGLLGPEPTLSGKGPIVIVFIILILRIRLPFWGPYHIQKLKKIEVCMGTAEIFLKM